MEGFAQLRDVALCLPVCAQLQRPADRVVVIHHICGDGVALVRLSHELPPFPGSQQPSNELHHCDNDLKE
jgi:hypothetical protein